MSSVIRTKILPSGDLIPVVGLGVYEIEPGDECYRAVLSGLKAGYRHIDTAQIYDNEQDVGQAIADSGVPRTEIFVTTKLWVTNFGYQRALKSIAASLKKLQTSYIDLLLLHAPGKPHLRRETWKALESLQKEGVVKNIGVSNFGEAHIEKLAINSEIYPAVNQIEVHPWLQRVELVKYCQDRSIIVQAYSPLAKALTLSNPVLVAISTRLNLLPAQVLIAWSLQKGIVPQCQFVLFINLLACLFVVFTL